MSIINIGIIREGKIPPDFRVPLSPEQCVALEKQYPNVKVTVQNSPIRCFADQAYSDLGLSVQEDLSHCDILLGVKEEPKDQLIAGKGHTSYQLIAQLNLADVLYLEVRCEGRQRCQLIRQSFL